MARGIWESYLIILGRTRGSFPKGCCFLTGVLCLLGIFDLVYIYTTSFICLFRLLILSLFFFVNVIFL